MEPQTQLPSEVPFSSASLYTTGGEVSNVSVGQQDGLDYVCFDWNPRGELSVEITLVAVRAVSPSNPMTWLARSAAIRMERVGEWIFVYDPERLVEANQRLAFVNDVMTFLDYAKEFPQNR